MARKVTSFNSTWNVGPESKTPAYIEINGISYKVGLATRHELACRGVAKSKCADLIEVAWNFAQVRGKDMVWLEDLLSADVAIAAGTTVAKIAEASDEAVRKVSNEILRKTTVSADAQAARRSHAKSRRVIRREAAEAQKAAAKAEREAKKAAKAKK